MGHIQLSRLSDIILVAPATANVISKIAYGAADDLASTVGYKQANTDCTGNECENVVE